jgi:hypothetical protein
VPGTNTRDEQRSMAETMSVMQRQILRLEDQVDLINRDKK